MDFIKKVSSILSFSKTDEDILKILFKEKRLLVSEIADRIKRSERYIRQRLYFLIEKGFLKKEIDVLKNKRLAYRYSLEPGKKIVEEAKSHFSGKISELNILLQTVSGESQAC